MNLKAYLNATKLTFSLPIIAFLLSSSACSKKPQKPINYTEAEGLSKQALKECAKLDRFDPTQFTLANVRTNKELRNAKNERIAEYFPWVFKYESTAKPNNTIIVYVKETGAVETSIWPEKESFESELYKIE